MNLCRLPDPMLREKYVVWSLFLLRCPDSSPAQDTDSPGMYRHYLQFLSPNTKIEMEMLVCEPPTFFAMETFRWRMSKKLSMGTISFLFYRWYRGWGSCLVVQNLFNAWISFDWLILVSTVKMLNLLTMVAEIKYQYCKTKSSLPLSVSQPANSIRKSPRPQFGNANEETLLPEFIFLSGQHGVSFFYGTWIYIYKRKASTSLVH